MKYMLSADELAHAVADYMVNRRAVTNCKFDVQFSVQVSQHVEWKTLTAHVTAKVQEERP